MTSMTLTEGVVDTVTKVTDHDTVQDAIDKAESGPVYFPPGKYVVEETLLIRHPGVTLFGFGTPQGAWHPVEIGYAGEGAAIALPGEHNQTGFAIRNIFLSSSNPAADGVVIEGGEKYTAGFTFDGLGTRGFKRALHFQKTAASLWLGRILIQRCSLSRNNQAIVCEGLGITNLDVLGCDIRQNTGEGGPAIEVSGRRIAIDRCNLEGQPDPISIRDSCAVDIPRNYFEGHEGRSLVTATKVDGLWFEKNYQRVYAGETYGNPVHLSKCTNTHVEQPIISLT